MVFQERLGNSVMYLSGATSAVYRDLNVQKYHLKCNPTTIVIVQRLYLKQIYPRARDSPKLPLRHSSRSHPGY